MPRPSPFRIILLACALLALGGCSDEDPVVPDPEPVYPPALDRDTLMDNFARAYAARDSVGYAATLAPAYRFAFADGESEWDAAADLASTGRMFRGVAGVDETGSLRDGVQFITLQYFDRTTDWTTVPVRPPGPLPVYWARYDVQIIFYLESGNHTITVTSSQVFHATAIRDTLIGDEYEPIYGIFRHVEPSPNKSNEDAFWGELKRMYAPQDPGVH